MSGIVAPAAAAPDRSADDTGARLVKAAAEVFAEKGYDGAGVAEIARRAGLTTGAIYSRYAGKAELLAAAIADSVPEQIEQLFTSPGAPSHAIDLIRAVGEHLVVGDPVGRCDLLLEAVVAARRDPEVALVVHDAIRARKARWAALIDAAKEAGELSTELDTDALVHFAHAVGLGFLVYEAVGVEHPGPEPWKVLMAKLVSPLSPATTPSTTPTPTADAGHPDRRTP